MFKITDNKGFHLQFANGNTISVQFGHGNYCDNRNDEEKKQCANTEVWAWDKDGKPLFDEPLGWQTPEQVVELMAKYSK
jgi:hypothetical protein